MPGARTITLNLRMDAASRLILLSVGVASAAGFLWLSNSVSYGLRSHWSLWLILLATFLLAEGQQLHFEIRRQTFSITLADLMLVLGLFALGPLGMLMTRLAAALIIMAIRRVRIVKAFFNLCLFTMECSVFVVIVGQFSDGLIHDPFTGVEVIHDPLTWVGVWTAVVAFNAIGASLVILAIGWTQSWPARSQQISMAGSAITGGLLNGSLGLVVLIVLDVGWYGIFLVLIVAGALVAIYRSYAGSVQQHRTLGQVYDFAKHVEGSTVVTDGGHLAIEAVREMLNAQRAALWLPPADGASGRVAYADAEPGEQAYDGPGDEADLLRERVLAERGGVLFQLRLSGGAEREALQVRGAAEVIGVPLSSAGGVIGYMEVCDRRGDRLAFSAEDLRLLESLATHVSAASQNVQLLGKLRYDASHDRLTGLPNRLQLAEVIDAVLASTAGEAEVAVLVVDLGSLKEVNDTLGHDAGDQLLTAVAALLAEHVPAEATVGRMGGDEFAVVMPVRDLDDAEARALALRTAVSGPVDVAGVTVEINATIGVSLGPLDGTVAASLLQRADVALYAAHAAGQQVMSYLPAMDQSSLRRLHLGTQLREAMVGGQIYAVFQPLIDVGSNNVRSVETLLRWQHPRYGAVSPVDFIPLAERIGMITPLTMHVLRLALRQCRAWLDRDIRIEVAVNLSARTLSDAHFADSVDLILRELGVPAELLTFEITESSMMVDPATALPVLHALHGLGVKLAIDDFGTGYSSLAYLSRLPVDEVKIDKGFIQNMGTEINDSSITKAIIDLAHGLGLAVVAEGVEDELTRDLLANMGCDTIQGYLVSRPLPGPRLDRWLAVRTASGPPEVAGLGRRVFITSRSPMIN
ncbi:MAG: bifunctional diguanylate cyclase/phosphodiesterase [Geodermatophilaceae bacterium]|nr:bifunctional diguanylate cyclase/phosphodiesterase [Geodermatophilaceae bacterium]